MPNVKTFAISTPTKAKTTTTTKTNTKTTLKTKTTTKTTLKTTTKTTAFASLASASCTMPFAMALGFFVLGSSGVYDFCAGLVGVFARVG